MWCQCLSADRSVFAQLAQRWESILMCLANPVDHLLRVRTQHVALRTLLLLLILFLFIPVVPHSYRDTRRRRSLVNKQTEKHLVHFTHTHTRTHTKRLQLLNRSYSASDCGELQRVHSHTTWLLCSPYKRHLTLPQGKRGHDQRQSHHPKGGCVCSSRGIASLIQRHGKINVVGRLYRTRAMVMAK